MVRPSHPSYLPLRSWLFTCPQSSILKVERLQLHWVKNVPFHLCLPNSIRKLDFRFPLTAVGVIAEKVDESLAVSLHTTGSMLARRRRCQT